jgi:septal ring factor EnvC (AmiA/AmiB activator)
MSRKLYAMPGLSLPSMTQRKKVKEIEKMENEILKEILAELKEHSKELQEIKQHNKNIDKSINNMDKSIKNIEKDVAEIKHTINNHVYVDIAKLEKRIEALEKKVV